MGLGKHHIQVSDKTEIDMKPTEFKKQVEDVIKKNVQECKEIIKRVCELEYEKGYKDAYIRALKESIAIMDENGWHDVTTDSHGDHKDWILNFYDRFVKDLSPDDKVTILSCEG